MNRAARLPHGAGESGARGRIARSEGARCGHSNCAGTCRTRSRHRGETATGRADESTTSECSRWVSRQSLIVSPAAERRRRGQRGSGCIARIDRHEAGTAHERVVVEPRIVAAVAPGSSVIDVGYVVQIGDAVDVPRRPWARFTITVGSRIVDTGAADREERRPVAAPEPYFDRRRVAHFCGSQRAPRNRVAGIAVIHYGRAPILAIWAGIPAPAVRLMDPGTVVTRSPAPGIVVDPRPAKRIYPHPVTVVVRAPPGPPYARMPDPAIMPIVTPVSIVI